MKKLILFLLLIPALSFGDMNPYIAGSSGVPESPAVASGFIGNNAVATGNMAPTSTYEDRCIFYPITTTTPGQVSYGHAQIAGIANGTTMFVAIYSADRNTKHAEGSLTHDGSDGEVHIALVSPFTLVTGTEYNLAFGHDTTSDYYQMKVIITSEIDVYEDSSWTASIPLPNSISQDVTRLVDQNMRLWFTNTADGS